MGKTADPPAIVVSAPWPGKTECLYYVAAIDGKGGGDVQGVNQHVTWIEAELRAFRATGGKPDNTERSLERRRKERNAPLQVPRQQTPRQRVSRQDDQQEQFIHYPGRSRGRSRVSFAYSVPVRYLVPVRSYVIAPSYGYSFAPRGFSYGGGGYGYGGQSLGYGAPRGFSYGGGGYGGGFAPQSFGGGGVRGSC